MRRVLSPDFSPWSRSASRPGVRSARSGPKSVAGTTVEARDAAGRAAWARPEGRRFPADSGRQGACPMPHIALRAFPTLSARKRRADHDHGEKAGLRRAAGVAPGGAGGEGEAGGDLGRGRAGGGEVDGTGAPRARQVDAAAAEIVRHLPGGSLGLQQAGEGVFGMAGEMARLRDVDLPPAPRRAPS